MAKKDYYETLGVSKDASDKEIKSAFRKLAKEYHPDVSKDPNAEVKFKEAQEAYGVLGDEGKKSQYDQFGHAAFEQGGFGGAGAGAGGFDFNGFDFNDIFESAFGGNGGGGFGFNFGGNNPNRKMKGRDTLMRMNLTFEEAVYGSEETIAVNVNVTCDECDGVGGFDETTCNTCHGQGVINSEQRTILGTYMTQTTCSDCRGKGMTYKDECTACHGKGQYKKDQQIDVTIPEGVDNGNQIRLREKGEAGANGGPNGDLYIEFIVKDHPYYDRDDEDIYLEMPITIPEAILGTKKEVKTLHGLVKLNIPAGSETGDMHKLKGKGVKYVNSSRYGDMFVKIKVTTPNKLTKDQKKLIESLSKTNLNNDAIKEYEKFVSK